jgi:hypothetical protein
MDGGKAAYEKGGASLPVSPWEQAGMMQRVFGDHTVIRVA